MRRSQARVEKAEVRKVQMCLKEEIVEAGEQQRRKEMKIAVQRQKTSLPGAHICSGSRRR